MSIVGILAFISIKIDIDEDAHLNKEYKNIAKGDSINSNIVSSYFNSRWRGSEYARYLKLKDSKNYFISVKEQVNIKSKKYFGEVVKNGVHLEKHSGSDTLIVDTGKEKYYYILIFLDANEDSASFIEKIFR